MSGIRDTYPTWASVPAHIQRAVNAYDDARRQDSPWEWAMSERNKTSIAPMIEAAIEAAKPPPGADSGLAAADDNHKALVEAVSRHVFMGALKYVFGRDARTSDRLTLEQREATIQRLSAEALAAFQSRQDVRQALAPFTKETDHGEE